MEKYGTYEIYECAFCHKTQQRPLYNQLANCCSKQQDATAKEASGIKSAEERWIRRTDLEEQEHE